MRRGLRSVLITVVWSIAVIAGGGCATQKEVAGHWRGHEIVANGSDDEWQDDSPQYYNEKQHITVRVINDAQTLSLTVSTRDQALQRQLRMAGLTVWFDPQGGKEKVFGLHLPAAASAHSEPPGNGGLPPSGAPRRPGDSEDRPPARPTALEPLRQIEITYSNTTGPLEMRIDEVRRSGIDIGLGQSKEGRLIYEFDLKFSAAPSLAELKPGMVVGIGILAGASEDAGPMGPGGGPPGLHSGSLEPGGGGRPTGGMGPPGGGGGGGPGGKRQTLEVWLKVRLAGQAAG